MHPVFRLCGVSLLCALACASGVDAAHAQVTLDFENLSNPSNSQGYNSQGGSVTQNGFTVTDTSNRNNLFSVAPNGGLFGMNYTGSVALYNATGNGITAIAQNNGNPFTLNSIGLANLAQQQFTFKGVTVSFLGYVQGGGTVQQVYTHGLNDNVDVVTFGSGFTNLTSVTFGFTYPNVAFDNIVVTPVAVPEPDSVALMLGMGVSGMGLLVRRHRKSL